MNGILCVYKEKNVTSRDVVNSLCKLLDTKKIGHTGTLDPLATGVLVLGVNEGTKLIEIITAYDKKYKARIRLGLTSDTLDITGQILKTFDTSNVTDDMIDNVLNEFNCTYNQEVPKYSAIKINGKKLYEYARDNIDITLPSREVTIYSLTRCSDIIRKSKFIEFDIECLVSKGTYIRSLIRDIGQALESGAIMVELERVKQGDFDLKDCYTLRDIEEGNYKLKSIQDCLSCFYSVTVSCKLYKSIINGALIENIYNQEYVVFKSNSGDLLALYKQYDKDKTKMKPWKMFKTIA